MQARDRLQARRARRAAEREAGLPATERYADEAGETLVTRVPARALIAIAYLSAPSLLKACGKSCCLHSSCCAHMEALPLPEQP